jgi:hypothetical protein
MGHLLGGGGSSSGKGKRFLFSTSSKTTLQSTQSLIQWILGAPSEGLKRLGSKADH